MISSQGGRWQTWEYSQVHCVHCAACVDRVDRSGCIAYPDREHILTLQGIGLLCGICGLVQLRAVLVGRFRHCDREQEYDWDAFEEGRRIVLHVLGY